MLTEERRKQQAAANTISCPVFTGVAMETRLYGAVDTPISIILVQSVC